MTYEHDEGDDHTGYCAFCGTRCGSDDYCFGCEHVVCGSCYVEDPPAGEHDVRAHAPGRPLFGEDDDYGDGPSCEECGCLFTSEGWCTIACPTRIDEVADAG